jgi:serine/threonine protein kinase
MGGKNRRTRKQPRIRGGEFLGEGAQGQTYNAGCVSKGQSLCTLLTKSDIDKITLYTKKDPVTLSTKEEILEFVEFTQGLEDKIAKLFKYKGDVSKVAHDKLLEEIEFNKNIAAIYGRDAEYFTTITPVSGYKGVEIYGAYIKLNKKPDIYAVFGSKCDNKYTVKLKQFLIDILASLIHLNDRGYYHNDVKLDNIVLCGDTYKLIDWGASSPAKFTEKTHGSLLTTSPMRWYTFGYNQFLSTSIIGTKTYYGNRTVYASPIFKANVARINREFYEVMRITTNAEDLFRMYKDSFDVFMLGMTALHAVVLYKLDYTVFQPIIERMTSLKYPLGAKEALREASRLP